MREMKTDYHRSEIGKNRIIRGLTRSEVGTIRETENCRISPVTGGPAFWNHRQPLDLITTDYEIMAMEHNTVPDFLDRNS